MTEPFAGMKEPSFAEKVALARKELAAEINQLAVDLDDLAEARELGEAQVRLLEEKSEAARLALADALHASKDAGFSALERERIVGAKRSVTLTALGGRRAKARTEANEEAAA